MATPMLGEVLSLTTAFLWAGPTIISALVLKKIGPLNTNALRTLFAAISVLSMRFVASELQDPLGIDPNSMLLVTMTLATLSWQSHFMKESNPKNALVPVLMPNLEGK